MTFSRVELTAYREVGVLLTSEPYRYPRAVGARIRTLTLTLWRWQLSWEWVR